MSYSLYKLIQAKDISDEAMECAIITATLSRDSYWATSWDVGALLPEYPRKVILAKAKAFIRRGLITGCACDCRGDWEIEERSLD